MESLIEGATMNHIQQIDPEVNDAIAHELKRQQDNLELIASENIVSQAVLEAQGSVLTNKYAEGYPAKRYYDGCEHVDVIEQLAIDRAKEIFKAVVALKILAPSMCNFKLFSLATSETSSI